MEDLEGLLDYWDILLCSDQRLLWEELQLWNWSITFLERARNFLRFCL